MLSGRFVNGDSGVVWILIWQMQGHEEHNGMHTKKSQRIGTLYSKCCSEFVVFFVSLLCVLRVPYNFQSLGRDKIEVQKN